MKIETLQDVRACFDKMDRNFLGLGVTAFMRIIPSFFIKNYQVVAFKDSNEVRRMERYLKVFCLERELKGQPLPDRDEVNTVFFLEHPKVFDLLSTLKGETCLIVYQSYPEVEEISRRHGWRVVGNPSNIRKPIENKKIFREVLKKLDLPIIPGENVSLKKPLTLADYQGFILKYGPKLVFQLPDIPRGGGRGTFFIFSEDDFLEFVRAVGGGSYRGEEIHSVNVTTYKSGQPASVAVCLTRSGTLFSALQSQILDVPNVIRVKQGNGVFCGHSWDYEQFSPELNSQAERIVLKVGEYLQGQGYRGIFGIDFIAQEDEGRVYPVECNARYTGAFPMLSLLHIKNGLVPLDAFHILEFLDADVEIDVDKLNATYRKRMKGSHIILFNKKNMPQTVNGNLRAGLYRFHRSDGHIDYLKDEITFQDMNNDDEFIVTDGVPHIGEVLPSKDEFSRICRILFPYPITESANHLKPEVMTIIDQVYHQLDLRPVMDESTPDLAPVLKQAHIRAQV
ncbi:MAG: ATP-grasp domain-containing protein [Deltaproteobacteria bacterium]|nr:ATP-grasp domain-containing protein [Deltaproteobacteria bacterium]